MTEKTGLESQKEEVKNVVFGNPTGLSSGDKSMLQMDDTNRIIYDARQSELEISLLMTHDALIATDNRNLKPEKIRDQFGNYTTVTRLKDHWSWLSRVNYRVRANQLTIKGISRAQHLRQSANQIPITIEEESGGFWSRLWK